MDTKGEITDWKVEWNVDDVTDKEQIWTFHKQMKIIWFFQWEEIHFSLLVREREGNFES